MMLRSQLQKAQANERARGSQDESGKAWALGAFLKWSSALAEN